MRGAFSRMKRRPAKSLSLFPSEHMASTPCVQCSGTCSPTSSSATQMPIYEYHCPHCGKTFEEWLKTSGNSSADASAYPCPSCGTASPRILSNTSFLLKGGGWFVNHETPQPTDTPNASGDATDASAKTSADTSAATSANTSADASVTKSGGQTTAAESAPAASPAASDSGAGGD